MSAAVNHRYEFEGLRRFAAGLATAVGLPQGRSLALASYLLWFDAAGAPNLGIATLPWWLEAIDRRDVNPTATGRVVSERTSVAILDGENGLAPLVLERAAELAVEKARESGAGLVRVVGAGIVRSAAPAVAGIATGPMAGGALGPDRSWSLAMPSQGGLPLVVDPGLAGPEANGPAGRRRPAPGKASTAPPPGPPSASSLLESFWLGTEVLIPEGGWLIAAVSIPGLESFAALDERLATVVSGMDPAPGRLRPEAWETRRREVRQNGVGIEPAAWKAIAHWARRLSVDVPEPLAD